MGSIFAPTGNFVMATRVFGFGCSYTQGVDLSSYTPVSSDKPDSKAWPQKIVDNLNYNKETNTKTRDFTCHNLGHGGASAKHTAWQIYNTEFKSSDIVCILWPMMWRWCVLERFIDDAGIELDPETHEMIIDPVKGLPFSAHLNIAPGWSTDSVSERDGSHIEFYKTFYTKTDAEFNLLSTVTFIDAYLKSRVAKVYHITLEPETDPNWQVLQPSDIEVTDWLMDDGKMTPSSLGQHLHPKYHERLGIRMAKRIKEFMGSSK